MMNEQPHVLAVIPARGGSKGIPRKNVRPVAGVPLVVHSIRQCLHASSIERVVVSTDDPEIAAVSREAGAECILRPAELSTDTAPSEGALLHVLDTLLHHEGYTPDLVMFLQPTSPLRFPAHLDDAIARLWASGADSLFSSCPVHCFLWTRSAGAVASLTYDYRDRRMRQALDGEAIMETGSFYVCKPWVLQRLQNRLGGRILSFDLPALFSFQIDEPADIEWMEHLFRIARHESECWTGLEQVRLLALDFDGVMTDNRVLVDQNGVEAVLCNRADGWGIARLKEAGVHIAVISTEANPVVRARCRKLGIDCFDDCEDKLATLRSLAATHELTAGQVAYVGNDVNDLECLQWAGFPIAVAASAPDVLAAARYVTSAAGGAGAVREVADRILQARQAEAKVTEPAGMATTAV